MTLNNIIIIEVISHMISIDLAKLVVPTLRRINYQ